MPTPGTESEIVDTIQPPGDPADTSLLLTCGETLRGPATAEVNSLADLDRIFGPRQPYGVLHDAVNLHFSCGGSRAIVSRTIASTATAASLQIPGTSGNSLVWTASSTGDWGNGLKIQVDDPNPTTRRIIVRDGTTNLILEQTPEYSTLAELASWSGVYGSLTAGAGTGLPDAGAATSATGGASNRNAIVNSDHVASIDRFTPEHGTGSLTVPGVYTETVHLAMLAKASDQRTPRFAVLDLDPTLTANAKAAYVANLRENGHYGTAIGSRVLVRPRTGGQRWVSGSAFWTGRAAYTDATAGVGQAPAGQEYGEHPDILDVEDHYTEEERGALNEAGIVCIARVSGSPRIYGARSLADVTQHPAFKWVTGARVAMWFKAHAEPLLERRVLKRNSRQERISLGNDLVVLAKRAYDDQNLNPDVSFEQAARIDTTDRVNTEASRRAGWIRADVEIVPPDTAERVRLNLALQVPGGTVSSAQ